MTNRLALEVLSALSDGLGVFLTEINAIISAEQDHLDRCEAEAEPERHKIVDVAEQTNMSFRLRNVLLRGFGGRGKREPDLEDLCDMTRDEVMRMRNMGMHTLAELDGIMEKYGLHFKGES